MSRGECGGLTPALRPGATRRALLGAGAALGIAGGLIAGLTGLTRRAVAAPASAGAGAGAGALIDVLDRPALTVRTAAASPMLRLARCGPRLVAVGERGIVVISDDDGQRWQQAQVPVSVTLTGVQFTSDKRGFAIGHGGVVLRTDDAGQTWQRLLDGRRIPALLSPPEVAQQAELDGPDKPWLAMHFTDDRHGMVVGAFGMALETADGGQTWRSFAERISNPRSLHLYAVHRRDERVWIAGEQGLYAVSLDGGGRYVVLPTPYRGSFFALHALADGRALLGGLRGTLLLHAAGEPLRVMPAASSHGVVQLLALASGDLALVDQSGAVFTASLPDLRFAPVHSARGRTWLSVAQATDGAFVGASFAGVARLPPALSQLKP